MEYEVSGKTIEEAIDNARKQYELGTDLFAYEVVEYPKSGFLGIGGKPAVIRISMPDADVLAEKADTTVAPSELEAFVRGILEKMGMNEYTLDIKTVEDGNVDIVMNGEDLACFTHKQGDAIDGMQMLLSLYLNKGKDDHHKVTVDVNGYKQKTVKRLEGLAVRVAKQVLKTHRKVTLNPMSAYQRRIIHSKIQEFKSLQTCSVGTEPNRRVVISYVWPDGQKRQPRPEKANVPQDNTPVSEEENN